MCGRNVFFYKVNKIFRIVSKTLSFYGRTFNDYVTHGMDKIYNMVGSMEYEADVLAGFSMNPEDLSYHPGY